tara:strand:- start:52 stop:939 length:888 start_codon:yes stop_codon:yes gene_type:complete
MSNQNKSLSVKETIKSVESNLNAYADLLGDLLAQHALSPRQFIGMALNAVKRNDKLIEVASKNPKSLFASLLICAEYGLSPSPEMGECWLIPYGSVVQFQLGYQGILKIIYRNPNITQVTAEVVYENDDFHYTLGLNPSLHHVPTRGERGAFLAVYSAVKFRQDEPIFKVMFLDELKEFQKLSKAGNKGIMFSAKDPQYWMPKKTCVKQLCKLIPKEYDLATSMNYDNVIEGGAYTTLNDEDEVVVVEGKTVRPTHNKFAQAMLDEEVQEESISSKETPLADSGDVSPNQLSIMD